MIFGTLSILSLGHEEETEKEKATTEERKTKTSRCPYSQVKKDCEEDMMSCVKCWNWSSKMTAEN